MIGSQWFFKTSAEAVVGGRWSVSSVFNPMESSQVLVFCLTLEFTGKCFAGLGPKDF